jgi:hypothetical protein
MNYRFNIRKVRDSALKQESFGINILPKKSLLKRPSIFNTMVLKT